MLYKSQVQSNWNHRNEGKKRGPIYAHIRSLVKKLFFNFFAKTALTIYIYAKFRPFYMICSCHFSLASRNGHLLSTVQKDAILLANNAKHCWMLHVWSVRSPCVACAWLLLGTDAQSLSPVTLVATCKREQQFQTLLSQKPWELLRQCGQWCANGCNISQQ